MKNIEISKIIDPILTSDGAGVKLKRSIEIGRAHVRTPVTSQSRMPSSA